FNGSPSLAEPKQVNLGEVAAVLLLSGLKAAVRVVPLPSTWHELQLPLPLNSRKPAISSAVNVYLPSVKASNFDEKAETSGEASYWSREFPQWSKTLFAVVRSVGLSAIGVALPPNIIAP